MSSTATPRGDFCVPHGHVLLEQGTFAALSGLRLGEVLALRDTDVDLEDGCVLVRRSARKGVGFINSNPLQIGTTGQRDGFF